MARSTPWSFGASRHLAAHRGRAALACRRLAGLEQVAAVEREATDESSFRLALVENIHREDLSHQEQVEALDALADIVRGAGLRRAARELHISPGWLSRRLSMRREATIFPALEEGRITFIQANELLSAPAVARRTLLDRLLRSSEPVQVKELRSWVDAARRETRQSQQRVVAELATGSADLSGSASVYEQILEWLRAAPEPSSRADFAALAGIVERAQQVLEHARPRSLAAAS